MRNEDCVKLTEEGRFSVASSKVLLSTGRQWATRGGAEGPSTQEQIIRVILGGEDDAISDGRVEGRQIRVEVDKNPSGGRKYGPRNMVVSGHADR